jgi:hypothetical protein
MDNSKNTNSTSINQSSENELLRAYVSSLIGTTINIDKFTSWLLAIDGAIFSVIVANIKNVSEFIQIKSIKISLFALAFSFVFGGFQKIMSLLLSIDFDEELQLRDRFKDLDNSGHGSIIKKEKSIIAKAIGRFKKLHPWYIKILMVRNNKNIDLPLKRRVHRYYLQHLFVLLSVLSFLIFMALILLNIKAN